MCVCFFWQVEPHYGSEYSCEAISDDLIESWETCGRREELRLPEPNPVIATVRAVVCPYRTPAGILDSFVG